MAQNSRVWYFHDGQKIKITCTAQKAKLGILQFWGFSINGTFFTHCITKFDG